MSANKGGEQEARAALDAVAERLAEKVAPKLERLQAAKGSVGELREDVAGLNETVEELAEEVAEVKRAVKAARKKRASSNWRR
jgi:predicted  nucleic acid-binding Zn-ribbon protein